MSNKKLITAEGPVSVGLVFMPAIRHHICRKTVADDFFLLAHICLTWPLYGERIVPRDKPVRKHARVYQVTLLAPLALVLSFASGTVMPWW